MAPSWFKNEEACGHGVLVCRPASLVFRGAAHNSRRPRIACASRAAPAGISRPACVQIALGDECFASAAAARRRYRNMQPQRERSRPGQVDCEGFRRAEHRDLYNQNQYRPPVGAIFIFLRERRHFSSQRVRHRL